jgi:uncharacterized protein (DUF58 family)
MRRLLSTLVATALAAAIAGASPAMAAPRALQVTAVFVSAQCQGGDFANVKLTAQTSGSTGDVMYKWDWTNNGSFDTRALQNPSVQHLYGDELTVTARVGARDSTGATATDTIQFSTPRCP